MKKIQVILLRIYDKFWNKTFSGEDYAKFLSDWSFLHPEFTGDREEASAEIQVATHIKKMIDRGAKEFKIWVIEEE